MSDETQEQGLSYSQISETEGAREAGVHIRLLQKI